MNICMHNFPGGSNSKGSACNAGDLGLFPGLGRSPEEGNSLPAPVFLPGEFHGQRSQAGYSPWGCKESYMTNSFTVHFLASKPTFFISQSLLLQTQLNWVPREREKRKEEEKKPGFVAY